jgi:membrane-bound hydrogenase subunit mbhJ
MIYNGGKMSIKHIGFVRLFTIDLPEHLLSLLGRDLHTETLPVRRSKKSIFIRHLDGGSSNAPEMELTALTNPIYDLAQYGIRFVPSPRHADILLITGPLTWNMLGPAIAAFESMPGPRRIITMGDCASFVEPHSEKNCIFSDSYAVADLPQNMKESVVVHIAGSLPNPQDIIMKLGELQ